MVAESAKKGPKKEAKEEGKIERQEYLEDDDSQD